MDEIYFTNHKLTVILIAWTMIQQNEKVIFHLLTCPSSRDDSHVHSYLKLTI